MAHLRLHRIMNHQLLSSASAESLWARSFKGYTRFRRFFMAVLLIALCPAVTHPVLALASESGKAYTPQRGQVGKDVMWIPTPQGLVDKMLDVAKVTSRDRVFDLGAGDGIIAITAAGRHGAEAVGIEYNPDLAEFARRKAREAGVADKVRIITGDIFKEDFSSATVVTLYLYPDLNMRLRPTLLAMKPGTRVVSHAFTMGEWEPDDTVTHQSARAYLWVVPASVEGEWTMSGLDGGEARLNLQQTFQQVGGTLTRNGLTQPLVGARLRGDEFSFKLISPQREVLEFTGKVSGGLIRGTLSGANLNTQLEARRR
jgi:SAM-dependent methyltransferase